VTSSPNQVLANLTNFEITASEIEREHGVSRGAIQKLRRENGFDKSQSFAKRIFDTQRGSLSKNAVLTEGTATQILLREDLSNKEAAALYGVSPTTVVKVRKGVTWKHIQDGVPRKYPRGGTKSKNMPVQYIYIK